MNKRIQELAEQCRTFYRGDNGQYVEQFDEEKFAELLIKESIGVVNKRYMGDNNREDMEVRRCVEDLKKHFGVE